MTCEEKNPKEYHVSYDRHAKTAPWKSFSPSPKRRTLTNDCMYTNFEINANAAPYAYGKGRKQILHAPAIPENPSQNHHTPRLLDPVPPDPEPFLKKNAASTDETTEFYCNSSEDFRIPRNRTLCRLPPHKQPHPSFTFSFPLPLYNTKFFKD
ncbi:MAG: hypothetical protein ACLVLH_24530 [Eisenbergiella massiliensis]